MKNSFKGTKNAAASITTNIVLIVCKANVLETDSLLQDDDTDDTHNDNKDTDVDVKNIPNPKRKVNQSVLDFHSNHVL